MRSVRIIFFSPTGTTRKVLDGIAGGLGVQAVERLDLTPARARTLPRHEFDDTLALIGTPVHVGRVPVQMTAALRNIKTLGAPAILVVVYGNRAYEDALLELKTIVAEAGFRPVAAAAFVGEHSFSTKEIPIAFGRPDRDDLKKARSFGHRIRRILESGALLRNSSALDVPGNLPYRDRVPSLGVTPGSAESVCTYCGKCEGACPQEAITMGAHGIFTDKGKCILCCACIKTCSAGARRADPTVTQIAQKLALQFRDRKKPELFLPK